MTPLKRYIDNLFQLVGVVVVMSSLIGRINSISNGIGDR
jgi:hypothetical protein